jgi:hypothetical protein
MTTQEIWPNFFIVGAPQAGTTSLYEYLKRVPGVYMCPEKEPGYFHAGLGPIKTKADYLKLFRGVRDEVAIGEASPGYLRDPNAPMRIREAVPQARIIMILRDPVDQMYSHYLVYVRDTPAPVSLAEAVRSYRHLYFALYAEPVQRYLETFPRERVKILIFEELVKDPARNLHDVLNFLDVDAAIPDNVGKAYNAYTQPRWSFLTGVLQNKPARTLWHSLVPKRIRHAVSRLYKKPSAQKPPMPEEIRQVLEAAYREDVLKLENILGRPLPWFHSRARR